MPTEPPDAAIRVTMLVRNAFTHDSRVEKEARTLSASGYAVTVVADAAPELPLRETRDRYLVVRVPRGGPRLPGVRFVRHGRHLADALVATQPDLLHAHDTDALATVAAVARLARVPFVYDAHELWLGRLRRGRGRLYWAALTAWYRWVERRHLPRASAWIAATAPIARALEDTYRLPHVETVMNLPELRPVEARSLRSLPGGEAIPVSAPIILYLGGLMPGRGLEQVIRALRGIPHAHLVCLGAGMQEEPMRALAREWGVDGRLHVLAPVAPEAVVDHAASATIGVSPIQPVSASYRHSLPNKLFEYMAAGIPVVASDFPQVRAVVEESGAGVCVDPTDEAALAAAISELLADPERMAEMGRNGRLAIERHYHWGVSADALLAVYDGLRRTKSTSRLTSPG